MRLLDERVMIMLVRLSRALALAAVVFAGWGVWQMLFAPMSVDTDPPLVIDWPAEDIGEIAVGTHEVIVRISNPANRPRWILGMMQGCRPNICFSPKDIEPVVIPPGGMAAYAFELDVHGSGPFEFALHLYLEENGLREVEQTLRGVAVAPGGNPVPSLPS